MISNLHEQIQALIRRVRAVENFRDTHPSALSVPIAFELTPRLLARLAPTRHA
jgi:hypothetical protein